MSEWFSVPFGIKEGKPMVAQVALSHPLKKGHLQRIAAQLLRMAAIAEEPLPDETGPYDPFWYAAEIPTEATSITQ